MTVALLVLLQIASTAAQEPNPETFTRYRAQAIERIARSLERLRGTKFDGERLDANISLVFGIPSDTRVINVAEIAFRDEHHITLTFGTSSADIVLTESKKTPDGTLLVVFHTDLTLALRGAASGPDLNNLQRFANQADAESAFRDVLMTWDRQLSRMLERQVSR
jgi:hypothetical protein